ncbi:hypothetical protein EYE40_06235 [Glaciihabitans arcticus]|uniref:Uncharacterized protein n=1 Tax=Glaciihabitans arcticus TaxID=2668039 RepID=A0A4Q9GXM6_9MICO|nr:hypothetical protein [Glaciihabitans arcticus]TBN57030.1 hypothetical protein EYE40_06235 [Glaciihabitans arcticus]
MTLTAETPAAPTVFDVNPPSESIFSALPEEGKELIAEIDDPDFELLERSIELVVQSQVFTPVGLEHALQLEPEVVEHLTDELEALGVIERDESDDHHEVAVEVEDLSLFLVDVRLNRRDATAA